VKQLLKVFIGKRKKHRYYGKKGSTHLKEGKKVTLTTAGSIKGTRTMTWRKKKRDAAVMGKEVSNASNGTYKYSWTDDRGKNVNMRGEDGALCKGGAGQ